MQTNTISDMDFFFCFLFFMVFSVVLWFELRKYSATSDTLPTPVNNMYSIPYNVRSTKVGTSYKRWSLS